MAVDHNKQIQSDLLTLSFQIISIHAHRLDRCSMSLLCECVFLLENVDYIFVEKDTSEQSHALFHLLTRTGDEELIMQFINAPVACSLSKSTIYKRISTNDK